MKQKLTLDHGRSLAAQDVEAQDGLNFSRVQFHTPALRIELADGIGRIGHRIEQGGDQQDLAAAEAFDAHLEADHTQQIGRAHV